MAADLGVVRAARRAGAFEFGAELAVMRGGLVGVAALELHAAVALHRELDGAAQLDAGLVHRREAGAPPRRHHRGPFSRDTARPVPPEERVGNLTPTKRLAQEFAQRREADLGGAALEDLDVQFLFQLLDRHRQGGLRHEAGLGGTPEMAFAGDGNDVTQFGEGHDVVS